MGMVTYFIDYIPKTVKAQLSPYLPFKEVGGVRGRGGGLNDWGKGGQRKDIFYLNNKRK